ncbi:hypothetical protein ACFX19_028105 [Malus domestica]
MARANLVFFSSANWFSRFLRMCSLEASLKDCPLSIFCTRLVKFNEHNVSPRSEVLGPIWTNIKVLQSPLAANGESATERSEAASFAVDSHNCNGHPSVQRA